MNNYNFTALCFHILQYSRILIMNANTNQKFCSFQLSLKKVKSIWHTHTNKIRKTRPSKPWLYRHVIYFTNTKTTDLGSVYHKDIVLREGGLEITEMWTNDPQSVSHISTGPQQCVMTEHQSCPASNWWGLSEKGSVYSLFYGGAKSRWRIQRTVSHLL